MCEGSFVKTQILVRIQVYIQGLIKGLLQSEI